MRKLLRATATVASALSIAGGGVAGIAGASSATTQGPNSPIRINAHNTQRLTNNNNLRVTNRNTQTARTGSAEVRNNTTGGDATSGMASNDNSVDTSVSVDNTGAWSAWSGSNNDGTVSTEGPNSPIRLTASNSMTVTNNNRIDVSNTSTQSATTGSARVSNNTTGGSATSGDATNTNSTTTSIDVSN